MNLLWHVIKKDLAALRWWVLTWTVACLTHLTLRLIQLHGGNEALPAQFASTSRADFLVVVLLSILIIPQIVQLDPPGAGMAFWKTVPISRKRLFFAKSLLILTAFVVFPFILEAVYFSLAGYGAVALRALEIWFVRMVPIVLIVAAAAALARDRRVAALLIGAVAILIVESAQDRPSIPQPETIAASIFNTPLLWSGLLACWLGTLSLPLFTTQYFVPGRFARVLVLVALLVTYPIRARFIPQIHWSPSEAAIQNSSRPGTAFTAQNSAPKEKETLPKTIALPPGAEVIVDPLPSYIAFVETARHGEYSHAGIRVAVKGLPKDVIVSQGRLTDCTLVMPSKTLAPVKPEDRETNYQGQMTVGAVSSIPDLENIPPGACLSLPAELFSASYADLTKEPGVITGKVRLTLTRLSSAGQFPLQPSDIWKRELHDFRIESAHRSVSERESAIDIITNLTTTTVGKPASFKGGEDYPSSTAIFLRNDVLKFNWSLGSLSGSGPIACTSLGQFFMNQTPSRTTDMTRERMWERFTLRMLISAAQGAGVVRGLAYQRLNSDLGDLEHWRMDLERRDDLGEVELPFRTGPLLPAPAPWMSLKNREMQPDEIEARQIRPELKSRAFRQALLAVPLRDPSNRKEVEEYLNRLLSLCAFAPNSLGQLYQDDILKSFSAVGSENLEALLSCAATFTMPEAARGYGYGYNSQSSEEAARAGFSFVTGNLVKVICDLTRDRDKALVLKYLSPHLDIYDAAEQHGWQAEALSAMAHFAEIEAVPERWVDLLVQSGNPEAFSGILAQISHGGCDPNIVLRIGQKSAIPAQDLDAAAWEGALIPDSPFNGSPSAWIFERNEFNRTTRSLRYFSRACATGVADIPRDLLCLLQMTPQEWSNQGFHLTRAGQTEMLEATLLDIFSRYSECPSERVQALSWLLKNAAHLRFNAQTRRYETL